MIEVTQTAGPQPFTFQVVVSEGGGATRHEVTMSEATLKALAGGTQAPEVCVDAAFRFLLDREPKESILARFDIDVIARYFPEFEREMPRYLQTG